MSVAVSLYLSGAATAVLIALHLGAPRLRLSNLVPERSAVSFAGGIAAAYVFLHLLPELASGNREVAELLESRSEVTVFGEVILFLVALIGFTTFYGLDRLADRGAGSTFGVHLGAFAIYNALITYSMALRFRTGTPFAILFVIAMGLHFLLIDRGLQKHYSDRFDRRGRFILAGALAAGWVLSAVAAPTDVLIVNLITAALSGSILLNVFREEIPDKENSSFAWFLTGLLLYAALLVGMTAIHV